MITRRDSCTLSQAEEPTDQFTRSLRKVTLLTVQCSAFVMCHSCSWNLNRLLLGRHDVGSWIS